MAENVRVIGLLSDYPQDACVFCAVPIAASDESLLRLTITGPRGRTMPAVSHYGCFRERVEPRQHIAIDFASAGPAEP